MRWPIVVALGAAFLACDESEPTLQSPAVIWCEALCSRVKSCGYLDFSCESDCVRQRPGLMSFSVPGATALAPCIETVSCAALVGDDERWREHMQACWDQARSKLTPTEEVRNFCGPYASAWFSCGYLLPIDECESIYGMWSGSVLERVSACQQSSCESLDACVQGVFE